MDKGFGVVDVDQNGNVIDFREKKTSDGSLINAGYMVFNPDIYEFLPDNCDNVMLEEVLENLAINNKLSAYNHKGFWFGMDTQRDKKQLEEMWNSGNPKWKVWEG